MDRFKSAKIASVLGVICNVFLFIIKIIVGLISHSQSMIADAFNSGSDILSSIMTYIGNSVSSKEPDEDHNLGHGKAEYIYSMLIGIVMMTLGIKIFYDSFMCFLKPKTYDFSIWLVVVCVITIFIKLFLYLYTKKIAKKYNNLLVEANSRDHRNDVFITSLNLVSVFASMFGFVLFDAIGGLVISLWIIVTGIKIYKASYDVLMDKTISQDTKDNVMEIIREHKEIYKIQHFNATPVGYLYQVSFSIFVDGNLSTFESHDIANKLEKEIGEKIPEIYLVVIHVNPLDISKK